MQSNRILIHIEKDSVFPHFRSFNFFLTVVCSETLSKKRIKSVLCAFLSCIVVKRNFKFHFNGFAMNPFEAAKAGPSGEKTFKCEDCGKVTNNLKPLTPMRLQTSAVILLFSPVDWFHNLKQLHDLFSISIFPGIHLKEGSGPAHSRCASCYRVIWLLRVWQGFPLWQYHYNLNSILNNHLNILNSLVKYISSTFSIFTFFSLINGKEIWTSTSRWSTQMSHPNPSVCNVER